MPNMDLSVLEQNLKKKKIDASDKFQPECFHLTVIKYFLNIFIFLEYWNFLIKVSVQRFIESVYHQKCNLIPLFVRPRFCSIPNISLIIQVWTSSERT